MPGILDAASTAATSSADQEPPCAVLSDRRNGCTWAWLGQVPSHPGSSSGATCQCRLTLLADRGSRLTLLADRGSRLTLLADRGSRLTLLADRGSRLTLLADRGSRLTLLADRGSRLTLLADRGSRLTLLADRGSQLHVASLTRCGAKNRWQDQEIPPWDDPTKRLCMMAKFRALRRRKLICNETRYFPTLQPDGGPCDPTSQNEVNRQLPDSTAVLTSQGAKCLEAQRREVLGRQVEQRERPIFSVERMTSILREVPAFGFSLLLFCLEISSTAGKAGILDEEEGAYPPRHRHC
ncbi:hypothetical protein P7K49_033969 [Saguinus oedipus]|uniref:Uncharacterized protein n=1 Tax=Saguinus oedipus TaxID=9490 RepID=A0ABQ9TTF6_SAGOE|nr:hypothetical protein P7K49_033969 [Saguinus oedipus]